MHEILSCCTHSDHIAVPYYYTGRRVAELEMHILVAQLVKNFKIEDRNAKPVEFVTKLFYGPGSPIDLAFIDI